jgi:hypothetical protein
MLDVKKLHTGERRPCPLPVTAYSLHSHQPFMSSKGLHIQQKPEGASRCGDKASFNGDLFLLSVYLVQICFLGCIAEGALIMEAARTSETSVDN